MYSVAMMQILMQLAKKHSKHVSCLGVRPFKFERQRALNRYMQSWEIIEQLSDVSGFIDFESSDDYQSVQKDTITKNELLSLRHNYVIKEIAKIEGKGDNFDYYFR